jgi:hypothetical protein
MKGEKLFINVVLSLLIFGCVTPERTPQPTMQRTDDLYDSSNSIYHNLSVPFKIAFPKKQWKIYPQKLPGSVVTELGASFEELEKDFGLEVAMMGSHNSRTIYIQILIEHDISGLLPVHYLKIVKEANKEELSDTVDVFIEERKIGDVDCLEWEYKYKQAEDIPLDVTFRELIFLRNNYACRIRFWFVSILSEFSKEKIENLLDNISFPEIKMVYFKF